MSLLVHAPGLQRNYGALAKSAQFANCKTASAKTLLAVVVEISLY
jgi:hypothetical protein